MSTRDKQRGWRGQRVPETCQGSVELQAPQVGRDDIARAIAIAVYAHRTQNPIVPEPSSAQLREGEAAADAVVPLLAAAHATGRAEGVQAATRAIEATRGPLEAESRDMAATTAALDAALAVVRLLADEAHA